MSDQPLRMPAYFTSHVARDFQPHLVFDLEDGGLADFQRLVGAGASILFLAKKED